MKNRKKEHKCTCNAAILSQQLNDFMNPYAFAYPKYENTNDCNECPYSLVSMNNRDDNQNKALAKLYDDYCITPQNFIGNDITEEQKIELMIEVLDENRSLFHREEERIIHTEAFRRLQYKTQVMVNSASDDQRTRLLHSLEVQRIARKISIALNANYELAETMAIAHDIGHAPFGHAGEKAIKGFLENEFAGSFSHALQSVKVIDFLCSHRALKPLGLKGLGVSDLVLEGVLKHDSDTFIDNLSSVEYRLQYDCPNLYKPVKVNRSYTDDNIHIGSIESQIVCWADKIAYLGHDWEEFVAVELLEIMLSRINSIIIQLDEFIQTTENTIIGEKFKHIPLGEREILIELNTAYNNLKKKLASKKYSTEWKKNDPFIKALDNLIKVCYEIIEKQESENFLLFSSEQYRTLYAFFKVARSWMTITKVKPEKVGGKIDIIFLIYNYLNNTTSHRTVPALIDGLIDSCKDELIPLNSEPMNREDLIESCNKKWEVKRKELSFSQNKKIKSELRKCFAVHYNEEYTEATEYISNFTFQELINSTRVKYMTQKAKIIIDELMDYYYKNPYMLPLKHRKRIEFEFNTPSICDKTKYLLKSYYKKIIQDEYNKDLMLNAGNDFHINQLRQRIQDKAKRLIEHSNLDNESDAKKLTKEVLGMIDEHSIFVKDVIILRVIADYVSGMTDRMAEMKYNEICSSGTQWSKEYSERGIFNL